MNLTEAGAIIMINSQGLPETILTCPSFGRLENGKDGKNSKLPLFSIWKALKLVAYE